MIKLDRIDLKILSELEQNGRITNQDLSERVGLTPSPCLHRVRRLQEAGLIASYHAKVNWRSICDYIMVMTVVTLKNHGWSYLQEFEKIISKIPEVTNCFSLCGEYDYMLHFTVANMQDYQEILDRLLEGPAGIERIFSYIVMREVKTRSSFPIEAAMRNVGQAPAPPLAVASAQKRP